MSTHLNHVTLVARDLAASAAFYDRVLEAAGAPRVVAYQDFEDEGEVGEEAVGYGEPNDAVLWLVAGRVPTVNAHVALRAADRATVDAVAAVAGMIPKRRGFDLDLDLPPYYGVAVVDPDGNTVEVYSVS